MKALICNEFGSTKNLTLEEVKSPEPGAGQVLIDVHAAGINFPDVLTVQGKYQFKPSLPFTPGIEVSGVIKKVGKDVKRRKVGDEVISTLQTGAFASEVVTSENSTFLKGNMSFEQAAGFALTYGTSYYALKQRARLVAGETVLVLGAAGGVGVATIQLAKAMGANVIAAASNDTKLDFAEEAGADLRINYTNENLKERVKELTNGQGADVIYDPVGGDFSEQAFRAIAWNGRFLVIGFASGPIAKMPLNLALLKGASLVGVFWGSFTGREPDLNTKNLNEINQMLKDGEIKPLVSKTFPMERAVEAINLIGNRGVIGKVVLTN